MSGKKRSAPAKPSAATAATEASKKGAAAPSNSEQIEALKKGETEEVDPLAELMALAEQEVLPDNQAEELYEEAMRADARRMWDSR